MNTVVDERWNGGDFVHSLGPFINYDVGGGLSNQTAQLCNKVITCKQA